MGSAQPIARVAGLLAGAGLVIAAAAPFDGAPPRGVEAGRAPATVTLRVAASGALAVAPTGTVHNAVELAAPGAAAPLVVVDVTNRSPLPMRVSARMLPIQDGLGTAAQVRASVAGSVVFDGPLSSTAGWSAPSAQRLQPGERTRLRLRVRLRAGAPQEQWRGRADLRQLELRGVADGPAPVRGTRT